MKFTCIKKKICFNPSSNLFELKTLLSILAIGIPLIKLARFPLPNLQVKSLYSHQVELVKDQKIAIKVNKHFFTDCSLPLHIY